MSCTYVYLDLLVIVNSRFLQCPQR